MSGPIRSVINLQKSLLPHKLNKIPQFTITEYDSNMTAEEYRDILDEMDADISKHVEDINFQISAIDKWHAKWVELIDEIQDEEDKKAELLLFDQNALGNDGFLNVVQNAQASIPDLNCLRNKIRKKHLKMDRLTAAQTTTTGSTSVKVDDSEPPAQTPQLSQPKLSIDKSPRWPSRRGSRRLHFRRLFFHYTVSYHIKSAMTDVSTTELLAQISQSSPGNATKESGSKEAQRVRKCNVEKEENLWASELVLPTAMRTPDVLTGADLIYQYIDFSTTRELPSGFQLIDSKVGKLLSGKGNLLSESVCSVALAEKELKPIIPADKETEPFRRTIRISKNPEQFVDAEAMNRILPRQRRQKSRSVVELPNVKVQQHVHQWKAPLTRTNNVTKTRTVRVRTLLDRCIK
ncbi:hypothetical protein DdX_10968 [Ditylenchus destructor]|uniref:DUF1758 domain-containing protein n=1 Tax=Ditylenchus destructor TaxID=166010 RepID=A0AAD4R1M6_9BILA|nr:hypothetical protein DdX_10968 [Ditylenchus destructor]